MPNQDVEDFLEHFGVKGMKWGVRKAPEGGYSTESKADRKASRKALDDYIWNAYKNEPMFRTMTKTEYTSLSTKGQTFAKGVTLSRK